MKLFGFQITRTKTLPPGTSYSTPSSRGGWWPIIREPFGGAWQRNVEATSENVLSFSPAFACVSLISSDIGKIRIKLVELDNHGIWNEVESTSFSPVLREPNHFQIRIKFIEQWVLSKLIHGNAYILKGRDNRGIVTSLYVLDPTRVKVLVAPDRSVYYELQQDHLSGLRDAVVVPASEIIHDVMVAMYHPLCGVSPITACGLPALLGLRVQNHSSQFFANGANPGGLLTSPHPIDEQAARDAEARWNSEYGGANAGKIAVLGDGLKYEAMTMSAVDSQLIEQLKWTAHDVCTAFRVPPFMIGVGPFPSYNNVQALNQQYYSQCLQELFECIEAHLDKGLGLNEKKEGRWLGTEFEIDSLLRMDTSTRMSAAGKAIKSGASPNEVRKKYHDLGPVEGGETPYMQEQNWPLRQLAARQLPVDEPKPPKPMPGDSVKVWRFEAKHSLSKAFQNRRTA